MKKTVSTIFILTILLSSCANEKTFKIKEPDNTISYLECETYGFFNEKEIKNPNVDYRLVNGNVVWSIILVETIIAPIYFIGFSIYEPVKLKECYPSCNQ